MSVQEDGADALSEVTAIGISFGNSNSSIAYTSEVFPPVVFPHIARSMAADMESFPRKASPQSLQMRKAVRCCNSQPLKSEG